MMYRLKQKHWCVRAELGKRGCRQRGGVYGRRCRVRWQPRQRKCLKRRARRPRYESTVARRSGCATSHPPRMVSPYLSASHEWQGSSLPYSDHSSTTTCTAFCWITELKLLLLISTGAAKVMVQSQRFAESINHQ